MNIVLNALLVIVGAVCVLGVFHRAFNDTLLERIGMSAVALWSLLRVSINPAHLACEQPLNEMLLYAGLATYSVGCARAKLTAWKRKHPPGPPPVDAPPTGPNELDSSVLRRRGLL